jgi:hypothetical protein
MYLANVGVVLTIWFTRSFFHYHPRPPLEGEDRGEGDVHLPSPCPRSGRGYGMSYEASSPCSN